MQETLGRRELLSGAGALAFAGALHAGAAAQESGPKRKIIGVACSARPGKTTAAALELCLQAAREADAGIETELIELAGLSIPAQLAAGQPLRGFEEDDFPAVAEKIGAPEVAGLIVASPVYFNNMSALCKAFLERCMLFRKDNFKLGGKVAGAIAVGSSPNGGQELTVTTILAALNRQNMIAASTGLSTVRAGAMLRNQDDSIEADEFGRGTAKDLGRNVAALTQRLA